MRTINLSNIKNSEKFLGTPRIKPGAAGWEAQPLCYAIFTILCLPLDGKATFRLLLLIVHGDVRSRKSGCIFQTTFCWEGERTIWFMHFYFAESGNWAPSAESDNAISIASKLHQPFLFQARSRSSRSGRWPTSLWPQNSTRTSSRSEKIFLY